MADHDLSEEDFKEMASYASQKEIEHRAWWEGFGRAIEISLAIVVLVIIFSLIYSYDYVIKHWCYLT